MEFIGKTAEYGLNLLIAFAIVAVVVIALGAWMQNNPYLQERRNRQASADVRATIARENARR